MATGAQPPARGGALCRSCRMVVPRAIVSLGGIFAGDFSARRTENNPPRASRPVYVRVVFAQIRARVNIRAKQAEIIFAGICTRAWPIGRYFRIVMPRPTLSRRVSVRNDTSARARLHSAHADQGNRCYAPRAPRAESRRCYPELERLRACHTRYYPLRKFPLRDTRSISLCPTILPIFLIFFFLIFKIDPCEPPNLDGTLEND